jgi:hypothetical protein
LQPIGAVKYGDEQFGNVAGGRFWAFHSAGISIVNPDTCRVEKTFKTDADGNNLPNSWSDGVYMEPSSTTTDDQPQGYVLINSGVTRYNVPPFPDTGTGEILVLSTNPKHSKQPVMSRIDVGGRAVHSYGVTSHDQVRQ